MKKIIVVWCFVLMAVCFGGCSLLSEERVKLRDLDFTVLSEEKIPQELAEIIAEKKQEPFKLTYSDNTFLYICIGYGVQETGGYSIAVNQLYLTDTAVCVNTSLLGPSPEEMTNKAPSYPYIVIKTELLDKTVIFE